MEERGFPCLPRRRVTLWSVLRPGLWNYSGFTQAAPTAFSCLGMGFGALVIETEFKNVRFKVDMKDTAQVGP